MSDLESTNPSAQTSASAEMASDPDPDQSTAREPLPSTAASVPAASHALAAGASASSASLAAIDRALAADIDNLLQGDFESIETVLDGVFDEKAALVQNDRRTPAEAPLPKPAVAQVAAIEPVAAPAMAKVDEPPPPTVEPAPSPPESAVATPLLEIAAAPLAEAIEPVAPLPIESPKVQLEAKPTGTAVGAPEATELTETAAAVMGTVEPQPEPTTSGSASPASVSSPARTAHLAVNFRHVWSKLTSACLVAMALINLPMRFVPASAHLAVNILALSLALWAPVVWLMAPAIAQRAAAPRTVSLEHAESKLEDADHGGSGRDTAHGKSDDHGKTSDSKKKSSHGGKDDKHGKAAHASGH